MCISDNIIESFNSLILISIIFNIIKSMIDLIPDFICPDKNNKKSREHTY